MATKKKLLQAAAGTAAAGGALNVEDVFSTYLYEGNGSSQVIENGINLGQSNDGGSVEFDGSGDYLSIPTSSEFAYGTGDFTVECWVYMKANPSADAGIIDQRPASTNGSYFMLGVNSSGQLFVYVNTAYRVGPSATTAINTNTWYHVAYARSSGTGTLYVNGTSVGSWVDSTNYVSGGGFIAHHAFNAADFNGHISNARTVKGTAVYTSAFTAPTSALTAVSGTSLLTCQGSTPFVDNSSNSFTITVNGDAKAFNFGPFDAAEAGEGGLVWIKARNDGSSHSLHHKTTHFMASNETGGETSTTNSVSSFNSNGFSLGSYFQVNSVSGYDYVSWTFRKAPKFFTCVQYTGDGTNPKTISHDLGHDVGMMIIKRTDSAGGWFVWHRSVTGYGSLNATDSWNSYTGIWADTNPTSTSFTVDNNTQVNASGGTYVAYLFAHNDGDGEFGPDGDADIIKCGSYTGNGSSTGPEIDLGFEPQWVLFKNANSNENWVILDSMRGFTSGVTDGDARLYPNATNAEATATRIKPLPNGFQPENSDPQVNSSGDTYIYIAIRRGPMAVPTDATEVFDVNTYSNNGNSNIYDTGFNADMNFNTRYNTVQQRYLIDRLRGNKYLLANSTSAETTATASFWDEGNNLLELETNWWASATDVVSCSWKRAPNYFDAVAYTGNGTAGRTVSHNLGVAPEMMWVKRRDSSASWRVYHKDLGATNYLILDTTQASTAATVIWNDTAPTSEVFSVGSASSMNASGGDYIAYLFASLDGVSKVGSFTHTNGTATNVDCGFSSGARFVLWKPSSFTGNWIVMDTERGIVSGNDPYLNLNTTDAENSSYDIIDALSSGFTVGSVAASGTYIFYAIA